MEFYPGTVIKKMSKPAKALFDDYFKGEGGIMLKYIREITGLDSPTIQNWIARGWVSKPVHRKYSRNQLAVILIICSFRNVTELENIARVIDYVCGENGIISEERFYCYVADATEALEYGELASDKEMNAVIDSAIRDFIPPCPGAKKKLHKSVKIFVLFIASEIMRQRALAGIADLREEQL